ncbi:MAG: fatty acyl-AMP ligase [Alphaproteobacteria bacterium]|nr:fatty acyl-AMP ligase [Alphaproteobacteria bacterium]
MTWDPSLWGGRWPAPESKVDVPPPTDLVDMVERPASLWPDAAALKFVSRDGVEVLSYGELWTRVRAQASRFRALGLGAGDAIVIGLTNRPAFVEMFWGALLLGACPVPIAPPTSRRPAAVQAYFESLQRVLADSGARGLVLPGPAIPMLRAVFGDGGPVLVDPEAPVDADDGEGFPRPAPGDLAFMQYTSGSTSDPRGVRVTHANLMVNNRCMRDLCFTPRSVLVSWLPMFHDMGLIGMLMTPLFARAPVVILEPFDFVKDPSIWFREMARHAATITTAPNFAFGYSTHRVDLDALEGCRLDAVCTMFNGAEAIDAEAMARFQGKFAALGLPPHVVRPAYGLAEATLAVAWAEPGPLTVDRLDRDALERDGEVRAPAEGVRVREVVSVGPPIAGHEVRVLDADGRALPDRRVGEVVVRGPSITDGYHRRPDLTAQIYGDGWLRTGDLGYLADGRLFLVGRLKDLIIRNGRNYHPSDVEGVVTSVPGVRHGGAAAFAVDEGDGERVVVVAETREVDPASRQALARAIRSAVADTFGFVPDALALVEPNTIEKTTSGKVRRHRCRDRWLAGEYAPGRCE